MNAPPDTIRRGTDGTPVFSNPGHGLAASLNRGSRPDMPDFAGSAPRTSFLDTPGTVRDADPTKRSRHFLELSPEARLVLAGARTHLDEQSSATLHELLAHPLDWNQVMKLAERHRVRPLLLASLSKIRPEFVPKSVFESLRDFASVNARRSLFLSGELFRVLDLLRAHDIPAAPFKGPALAIQAYGNISLREAGDLDVLVRRCDIVRARKLLLDAGFQPGYPTANPAEVVYLRALRGDREVRYLLDHCEHHLIREPGGINIDLHWALALRQFALPITPDELWTWLSPQSIGGRPVLGFGPEEMLLVLCINGAKDCWRRLDRICDVAELRAASRTSIGPIFSNAPPESAR